MTHSTRRAVLVAIGAGAITSGTVIGKEGDSKDEEYQIDINFKNCYTCVIKADHPDAAGYVGGVYFRESEQYAAPGLDAPANFDQPLTLNLRSKPWARREDGVFTGIAVVDIGYTTLASKQAPAEWSCEDGRGGRGHGP